MTDRPPRRPLLALAFVATSLAAGAAAPAAALAAGASASVSVSATVVPGQAKHRAGPAAGTAVVRAPAPARGRLPPPGALSLRAGGETRSTLPVRPETPPRP